MSADKLPTPLFQKSALSVAPRLLGAVLHHRVGRSILSGIIVEVEAYAGPDDAASHAHRGLTARNAVMFDAGGAFYVYMSYGSHYCCNVVTGRAGSGEAVLIRAIEPLDGIERMAQNRFGKYPLTEKETYNLTSGPGKLCRALGITALQNGLRLDGTEVYLTAGRKYRPSEIGTSPRIGITKSADLPWRFYVKNNPFVSRPS